MADKKTDLYDRIQSFQQTTLANKPSLTEMIAEIRMMNFKIRPRIGDVMKFNFEDDHFIEALWNLGKLDEFYHHEYPKLEGEEQEAFIRIINEMRFNFQNELNKAGLTSEISTNQQSLLLELEIFRELSSEVN